MDLLRVGINFSHYFFSDQFCDPLEEEHLDLSKCITADLLSFNVMRVMIPSFKNMFWFKC